METDEVIEALERLSEQASMAASYLRGQPQLRDDVREGTWLFDFTVGDFGIRCLNRAPNPPPNVYMQWRYWFPMNHD